MADKNRTHTTHTRYRTPHDIFNQLGQEFPDGYYIDNGNGDQPATTFWFCVRVMDVEFTWFKEMKQ